MASTESTDLNLEEELAMYDDCVNRGPPTWDKDAVVTPRAFVSEYGYDLDAEQIPPKLGCYLLEEVDANPVLTLVRTFGDTGSFERKDPDRIRDMVKKNGYNAVKLFRLDGTDVPVLESYARGGFLAVYSYIRGEEKREKTGHDKIGHYWLDVDGAGELVKKLLYGPGEGPWGKGANGRFVQEWEEKPNPAGRETWAVASLRDRQLNKPLAELATDHLLDDALRVDEGGPFQGSTV